MCRHCVAFRSAQCSLVSCRPQLVALWDPYPAHRHTELLSASVGLSYNQYADQRPCKESFAITTDRVWLTELKPTRVDSARDILGSPVHLGRNGILKSDIVSLKRRTALWKKKKKASDLCIFQENQKHLYLNLNSNLQITQGPKNS